MSTTTMLPPEMICDILSRLPVKSLLRFRSASKPLCSLIDAPYFTKQHLNCSKQSLVLASYKLHSIDLPCLQRAVEIHHPLKTEREATVVIGSCNGLLCLCNGGAQTLALFNNSTGKHHQIPHHPLDTTNLRYVSHGFGHDPVHDDYKLMRIVCSGDHHSEVLLYSLTSNSWKSLGPFPYPLPPFPSRGMFSDGAIHWYIDVPRGGGLATAFDLATQLYRLIPMPPRGCHFVEMTAFQGRLCVVCTYDGKPTEMLALDKGRDPWCWVKLLSVLDPEVAASKRRVLPMA